MNIQLINYNCQNDEIIEILDNSFSYWFNIIFTRSFVVIVFLEFLMGPFGELQLID